MDETSNCKLHGKYSGRSSILSRKQGSDPRPPISLSGVEGGRWPCVVALLLEYCCTPTSCFTRFPVNSPPLRGRDKREAGHLEGHAAPQLTSDCGLLLASTLPQWNLEERELDRHGSCTPGHFSRFPRAAGWYYVPAFPPPLGGREDREAVALANQFPPLALRVVRQNLELARRNVRRDVCLGSQQNEAAKQ